MDKIIKVSDLEEELKIAYNEAINKNLLRNTVSFMEFKNKYIHNMSNVGYKFNKIKKEFYLNE